MDLRVLEPRLENWARAQLSGGFRGEDIGSVEGRYRKHPPEASNDPIIDVEDAARVNEAWKRCMPLDKRILQMYYVWRASAGFICRKLGLKQGRQHAHVWDFALYHAQQAIWDRLTKTDELVNTIKLAYTRPHLMTESVD